MRNLTLSGLSLAFGSVLVLTSVVLAGTTTTYTTVSYSGDTFYNWDNTSTSCACGNAVDWPVTMVFRTYADVNKVKRILGGVGGDPMYLRANDGTGWFWDSDGGNKKLISGYLDWFHHIRLYAPNPPDYFYSTAWGRYVLGTTHIDKNESSRDNKQFGWSETAEEWFAAYFRNRNYSVTEDAFWMANRDGWSSGRWEGNRFVLNNGYATIIVIPTPTPTPSP
ncbi:hypothetical protein NET02_16150 [Thermomicrobiaceae bacterium CFH 74404]|uniref:Uncharacterized protein n=1 Tax=Thermalbibacter longus TaxID=2951981 RepID=A0AA42BB80_9BACT|nr:hypothetical protein [Thermalbibacter longus]MCM8750676.1 hypothetical protein [Thermalbibacter longus]